MARGRGRWEGRDLRHKFPLPGEREAQPRFAGAYGDAEAGEIRFAPDGSLTWDGEAGSWTIHGGVLRVRCGVRDCEGAISSDAIYLLCLTGPGAAGRTQLRLAFTARRSRAGSE
jgi:hypothetical protein